MNVFEQCTDLWGGRLDILCCYFSPYSLLSMGSTNKHLLGCIQQYFSRMQRPGEELIWYNEKNECHLSKDVIRCCLLFITPLGNYPNKMVIAPVSHYYTYPCHNIYGWVLRDTEKYYESHGPWANWIRIEDCLFAKNNDTIITRVIRWR